MLANCFLFGLLTSLVNSQVNHPNLTLPWGTWQATKYDPNGDFFTFQNVRFGKAPIGSLRFQASRYPDPIPDNRIIQDSKYGPACHQVNASLPCKDGGRVGVPNLSPVENVQKEDCLFLDVYVPSSAFVPNAPKIPVIVWFFGGAYVEGSKDTLSGIYNGTGILRSAAAHGSKVIYIAGNYRVGAFGWLAGSYMEENATPNAGLFDQRLTLQWIQDYVHLVGGDKSKVTAWGESAGAGSILHHLIQKDGQQDPLFSKAFLQSPAFEWQWSRSGTLNAAYKNFAGLAGCSGDQSMKCLQSADEDALVQANVDLFQTTTPCTGLFPVGPALDGKLIKQLPALAFNEGKYWKGLESIVVSHVYNESGSFVPKYITNLAGFDRFLNHFFPESALSGVKTAVQKRYPAKGAPYFGDQRARAEDMIRDATFTCNTRLLYDAYHNSNHKTYMMQYDLLSAKHGNDVLPLYWNTNFDVIAFLESFGLTYLKAKFAEFIFKYFAPPYISYFTSHAIHGDPNTAKEASSPQWKLATNDSNFVKNVMQSDLGFFKFFFPDTTDKINTHEICEFWTQVAENITRIDSGAPFTGTLFFFKVQDLEDADHVDL